MRRLVIVELPVQVPAGHEHWEFAAKKSAVIIRLGRFTTSSATEAADWLVFPPPEVDALRSLTVTPGLINDTNGAGVIEPPAAGRGPVSTSVVFNPKIVALRAVARPLKVFRFGVGVGVGVIPPHRTRIKIE